MQQQMTKENWKSLKYFKMHEFECSHTGKVLMDKHFMEKLDELRDACGFSFIITSGYRDPSHPAEASKATTGGTHTQGVAADIAISNGVQRRVLIEQAIRLGFNGIGVAKGFIHVDTRDSVQVLWTY